LQNDAALSKAGLKFHDDPIVDLREEKNGTQRCPSL